MSVGGERVGLTRSHAVSRKSAGRCHLPRLLALCDSGRTIDIIIPTKTRHVANEKQNARTENGSLVEGGMMRAVEVEAE